MGHRRPVRPVVMSVVKHGDKSMARASIQNSQ